MRTGLEIGWGIVRTAIFIHVALFVEGLKAKSLIIHVT
jgi:hypothetical protein